jgi:hypothetical protein
MDREKQVMPATAGCVRAPSLFSGSFDGKNLALEWTYPPMFCPSISTPRTGIYVRTGSRTISTLQLNGDGSLSGTYTHYGTNWKKDEKNFFDYRSLVPDPPETSKADGVCIKCQ